eukprot:m.36145 g.36145  ORF g.36145 m.36145 type:complete len:437 (+) comp12452_c0_seq1:2-1312(+)
MIGWVHRCLRSLLLLSFVLPAAISSGCQFVDGVDAHDEGYVIGHVASRSVCCQACASNASCAMAVFDTLDSTCYAKYSVLKAIAKITTTACVPGLQPSAHQQVGAVHWGGCYNRSTAPFLLDGAQSIQSFGFRTIKIALSRPTINYPWNSPLWPQDSSWSSVADIANHTYFQQLFSMPSFDTFVIVAYSTVDSDEGYFRYGPTVTQLQAETQQFRDLSLLLMTRYPTKKFVLQHWEGDWLIRGKNNTVPPSDIAINGMIQWLQARQAGVSEARKRLGVDNVLCASEVNLVVEAMKGTRNVINGVIPHVQLDLVSYSSYDSQCHIGVFESALAFIESHHNKTRAAPTPGVYVGEYGLPEQTPAAVLQLCVKSATATALAFGVQHLLFWEVYGNEPKEGPHCSPATGPVYDPDKLKGWWLIRPNGTEPWATSYLQQWL